VTSAGDAPPFGAIQFGFASAEKEGAEAPDLLLSGYFDDAHLSDTALYKSPFLFLGYLPEKRPWRNTLG
jgi:hypothetical protein